MISEAYDAGRDAAFEKLSMQGVAVINVVNNGKMLMGIRRDNKKFTQAGGHIEKGESPIDGAQRELFEETGIQLKKSKFIHQSTRVINTGKKKLRIHSYRVDLKGKPPKTTMQEDPDQEVKGWRWMKPDNEKMLNNLHVPLEQNAVFKDLMNRGLSWSKKLTKQDFRTLLRK